MHGRVQRRAAATVGALLALAPAVWMAGCGGETAEPASDAPVAVELVPFEHGALPALFADRIPPPSDAVKAHMALRDPSPDNWPTEVAAGRAEEALRVVLEAALEGDAERAAAHLAGDFTWSPFQEPARTLFDDGATTVVQGSSEGPERSGFEGFSRGLREALGTEPAEVTVQVWAIPVTNNPFWFTEARVELSRRGAAPAHAVMGLRCRWDEATMQLEHVGPRVEYEQARATGSFFEEVTTSAFGAGDFFASELLRGIDDYYMKIDRRAGTSFQGMQGLAVGDVNGDGREDVFLCQQVGLANRLLLQNPDGTATDAAGEGKVNFLDVTRCALILDLDNDGDQDLALGIGPNLVIGYNDGAGVFKDPLVLPDDGREQVYSLSAADPDGDGDLDLYAGRYALEGVMHGVPSPYHDADNGATNKYWRNDGPGQFTDATEEAGFAGNNHKFTLASVWDDFDEDGDLDLYVVNDFGRNNLFRNDGSGHFEDVAEAAGAVDVGAGMGAAVADFDLDGDQDLYVTNMYSAPGLRIASQAHEFMGGERETLALHPWYVKHASGNTLLANRGDGTFEDVTRAAGVGLGRWAWGGVFTDFNNDGLQDLYVPCGHATRRGADFDLEAYFWHRVISSSPPDARTKEEYASAFNAVHRMVMYEDVSWNGNERNLAYLNTGGGRFADVSGVSGADFPDDSRAAALCDWDEDGRVDLLLRSRNAPRLRLLRNAYPQSGGWIAFELLGTRCNRDAIGARVSVELADRTLRRRLHAGDGYLAQSSKRLHFGLGDATRVERVVVDWPDGTSDVHPNLAPGRRWRIVQGEPQAASAPTREEIELPPGAANWNPDPVARVVLADRLPVAAFPAPSFEDPARRLEALAGRPLLVLLWTSEDVGGEAALSLLAARRGEIERAGLTVVPLATDEGPALAKARRLVERYGLDPHAGFADGRVREAYEMAMLEVLGFFRRVPSPIGLLLDPAGGLAVVYLGPPDPDVVLADLATLKAIKNPRGTARLMEGRWLTRRARDYAELAQIYGARGFGEVGRYYEQLATGGR